MLNQSNQYLRLERKTTVQTSSGNTSSYTLESECWGRVHPYRSRETLEAGSNRAEVTHVVWIRKEMAIKYGSHRVVLGLRVLEIVEPPVTIGLETRCYCREVL